MFSIVMVNLLFLCCNFVLSYVKRGNPVNVAFTQKQFLHFNNICCASMGCIAYLIPKNWHFFLRLKSGAMPVNNNNDDDRQSMIRLTLTFVK